MNQSVLRVAEPVMLHSKNIVEVNYNLFVHEQATGTIKEISEKHQMRYLFLPEIDRLLLHMDLLVSG